ncbi:MAG: bifunctional hydroxymethylpyrimidine kinase/phosphomethylpyrimidine kinase [Lentisphaerae bacterium]|nr:bifunctional hydroxymethylpyrimidine kinase/phosphomethylpyrimidine kinase [Lentisphaerota bacterium]
MTKRTKMQFYPSAMSVTASDSGGGAGIAADLRTFNALGVYATCAVSAVTCQNPAVTRRIEVVPADIIACQIDTVMEKIAVRSIKAGMLFSAESIRAVAEAVKKYDLELICDPEMLSLTGKNAIADEVVEVVKSELFPLAAWITLSVPEAETILGKKIAALSDMLDAAGELMEMYSAFIWLKGGAVEGKQALDVIAGDGKIYTIASPKLELLPQNTYGAGTTLSAALTGMLALDMSWKQAVCAAKAFVYGSLAQSVEIGKNTLAMYPPSEDFYNLIKLSEAGRK